MKSGRLNFTQLLVLAAFATGCAANPIPVQLKAKGGTAGNKFALQEKDMAQAAYAGRIIFHHSDFFSLATPEPVSSCAGDAKRYYDAFATTADISGTRLPAAFPKSVLEAPYSVRPAFIKNASVDLTDSNASIGGNNSLACTYGNGSLTPPTTSCATFDYGAIGGVPTSLGGTILLIGGVAGKNRSAPPLAAQGFSAGCGPTDAANQNNCARGVFALGVDTLPGSGSISTWAPLSGITGYTGPSGSVGSSISFIKSLNQVILFGGASPVGQSGATGPTGPGADTIDTWSFDLTNRLWTLLGANPFATNRIVTIDDLDNVGTYRQLSQAYSSRALHGYVAVPGISVRRMGTNQAAGAGDVQIADVDLTDRIVVQGGLTVSGGGQGVSLNSYKFNPTFGPEWIDVRRFTDLATGTAQAAPAGSLIQWVDSYHTQLLSNSNGLSQYQPLLPSTLAVPGSPSAIRGFSLVIGQATAAMTRTVAGVTAGYAVAVGGFDTEAPTGVGGGTAAGGGMYFTDRSGSNVQTTASFTAQQNTFVGNTLSPMQNSSITEASLTGGIPWYGGANLQKGFSLGANDLVYFGGTNCLNFMTDATLTTAICQFNNPGRYYRVGDPITGVGRTAINFAGTLVPALAGMATARGEDAQGRVITVAWGGMSQPVQITGTNIVHVLFDNNNNANNPAPTWMQATPDAATVNPPPLTSAAMSYSHITGKFYLFGGYRRAAPVMTLADTWELTIKGTAGAYAYLWRQLNQANGLSCWPACPGARRGHRIAEVNYLNRTPTAEPVCTNAAQPCSFGIFMEGGTPDGMTLLTDRWMFDPTANRGWGHWQRVDGLPPRHFGAAANVEFELPANASTAKRMVLFGGETALQNPLAARTGNFFLPPTLGDTYMYDAEANNWNRVELLGKGYVGPPPANLSEFERRQAFNAINPQPVTISELSPPPLAGAVMIARTHPRGSIGASTPPEPLDIPELYLVGGRFKDGSLMPLNQVYKFCAGSTGERPSTGGADPFDNASCDAFDSDENANSTSPQSGYVGRWIRKSPLASQGTFTSATIRGFLGAGVYDSARDRVVLFGGLTQMTVLDPATASNFVYEYTPPSKVGGTALEYDGSWDQLPVCTATGSQTPNARYGHTMTYDPGTDQLVVIGGYDPTGVELTDSISKIPEVWTAKRVSSATALAPQVPNITNAPCYYWQKKKTSGNNVSNAMQAPPSTELGFASAIYLPASGYNTGYYSMFDSYCAKAGPVASQDPEISKLLAGGAYIDIDRTALGPRENLLLNLTYMPLGTRQRKPSGEAFTLPESAIFKVHLVRTNQLPEALRRVLQPRHFTYSDSNNYPQVIQTLSVMAPPTGSVVQDQLVIPLGLDPGIDRIRIERYSGSAILLEAALYRMGYK